MVEGMALDLKKKQSDTIMKEIMSVVLRANKNIDYKRRIQWHKKYRKSSFMDTTSITSFLLFP